MTTAPSVPGAQPVIICGMVAALVAGIAIFRDNQSAAAWAAMALCGAAAWLGQACLRRA